MSTERALLDALAAAVVVGPDDKLLLLFRDVTRARFEEVQNSILPALYAAGLQGRIVLLAVGNADMAVLRGES